MAPSVSRMQHALGWWLRLAGRPLPRLILPVGISALVFLASSRSDLPVPAIHGLDKLLHGLTYFVLGLSYLNFSTEGFARWNIARLGWGWGAALAFAASDEWHQSMVPGRMPDLLDLLADAVGITLALLVITTLHSVKERHR